MYLIWWSTLRHAQCVSVDTNSGDLPEVDGITELALTDGLNLLQVLVM